MPARAVAPPTMERPLSAFEHLTVKTGSGSCWIRSSFSQAGCRPALLGKSNEPRRQVRQASYQARPRAATLRAPREVRLPLSQACVVALAVCHRSGRVATLPAAEHEEQQAQPGSPPYSQMMLFQRFAPSAVGCRAELAQPKLQKKPK